MELGQTSELLPTHLFEHGMYAVVLNYSCSLESPEKFLKSQYSGHFLDLLNQNLTDLTHCPSR